MRSTGKAPGMLPVPSRSTQRTRDFERSRSGSTRSINPEINPVACTDDHHYLDQETPPNSVSGSADYGHRSSASIVNDDAQPDDVVLVDSNEAYTDKSAIDITIVLVGNIFAGKTSFVHWYDRREPNEDPKATTDGEPYHLGARIHGQYYFVTLMDTAGQEKSNSIPPSWYRHADGAIVMYDITDYGSFKGVATWKKEIDRNCRKENIPYILVGNKVDIKGSHIEGKQTAKVLKMDNFLKTSAKTGEGIDLAIKTIIALVSKSVVTHQPINQENITISHYQPIKLTSKPTQSSKFQCC